MAEAGQGRRWVIGLAVVVGIGVAGTIPWKEILDLDSREFCHGGE